MNKHTIALSISTILATACFDSDEFPDDFADETSTSSGDQDSEGEAPESSENGDDDADAGLAIELLVNGEELPDSVLSAQIVELTMAVDSAVALTSLELLIDDEVVATGPDIPDTYALVLADASDNGVRVLTARATDERGNTTEDTVLLPVAVPPHGETVWEHRLDDGPVVGLAIGADDRSMIVTHDALHTIDATGAQVDSYALSYGAHASTATPDGGVIVLGLDDETIVQQRFDDTGTLTRFAALAGDAPPVTHITSVRFGDNDRLIATWAYACGPLPCQELVSLNHVNLFSVDGTLALQRDGSNPYPVPPTLDVGPSGDIYLGTAFPHDDDAYSLRLQRINQALAPVWTDDDITLPGSYFSDSVTTSTSLYIGGRFDGRAALAEYDLEGNKRAIHYLDGDEVLRLTAVGDDVVYASRVDDMGSSTMQLGRLSADGQLLWSVMSERDEGEDEEAWALERDALGHVHVLSVLGAGQLRLQRVAL